MTELQAGRPEFDSRKGQDFFFLRHNVHSSGIHPAYQMGTRRTLSPEIERPGRDAEHSSPSSFEIKKTWNYIHSSIPLHDRA